MSTRFGVLGTGFWADTCHAAGLASHPGTELVGVWGRDLGKASAVAERHGVRAEADLDALLAEVDAVAIAVAPAAQPELAVRAAEAGCHLLLEKPLALSTREAEQVLAAVERAGVVTLTYFAFHFIEPGASWVRDSLTAEEWHGGTFNLLASVLAPGSPFKDSRWRQRDGVVLWDAAPHLLSLMLPALGPVSDVTAVRGRGETVHIALGHEGGGVSAASTSLTVPERAERISFELWGPSGLSRYPDELGSDEEAYANAISALLATIETGAPSACDIAFSAEIVRVLERLDDFLTKGPAQCP